MKPSNLFTATGKQIYMHMPVKANQHKDATEYKVKVIDEDQEMVYIYHEGKTHEDCFGMWSSANTLF